MRDLWLTALDFIRNPIRGATLIVFGVLSVGAVVLAIKHGSYVHPGPAIAAGGLAIIVLMVGLVIDELWRAHHISPTRVLGLELLADRWQAFEPKERDSVILFEQISITLSVAELAYDRCVEISFIKTFPDTKIKGGTFLLKPGEDLPLVFKFDSVANIGEEEERYKNCVARRLGKTAGEPWVPPQRYGRIDGEDWGAITYSLIGGSPNDLGQLQTFGEYYTTHSSLRQIEKALDNIFEAVRPWWKHSGVQEDTCVRWKRSTLYGEYDRLTRKQHQVEGGVTQVGQVLQIEALRNLSATQTYVNLEDDLRLRNPLNWVRDTFEAKRLGEWITQDGLRRDSIVHGDFHAGNILVSEDDYGQLMAWLVDFPHTHVGPTVQDIARLEADIKFGLLPDDTLRELSAKAMRDVEAGMLPESEQFAPPLATLSPNQDKPTNEQLRKAWRAVRLLRKEGRKYMIGDDARPYCLALLHATLPTLYYRDRSPLQKVYAFISAALLCERLGG